VSEMLVPRVMAAARSRDYGKVAVAGGVAANSRIWADPEAACARSGDRLYLPGLSLCGDNGDASQTVPLERFVWTHPRLRCDAIHSRVLRR
ncbi:hypothetical protein NE579_17115, partial [Intestinimonas massiliensis]|nr:hypothetical protein [Intestinimonas massiliensis (ex Afouda et al. 2020)]